MPNPRCSRRDARLGAPLAGLAVAPDGTLLLSANGEGTVLRLTSPAGQVHQAHSEQPGVSSRE
ncbi:hypothetical protein [Kutzneria buriramensis]|uniref:hypothetical protein n=1 Tax=Streptomyces sp. NL15-2K TaxID=376149 RepID=UPI000FFA6EEC|nr:hypothetical protein [Kutzneria buriramensis]WKX08842.1 hypothetical protein Q4V64_15610 [Kutzneria buriramensis]GCB49669.1 hypothetical protein SNL152K_7011 [Streptomyces sp. NL15-2K]